MASLARGSSLGTCLVTAFFADDCTFLMARGPEPLGRRVQGKEAVRRVLADRFKVISDMRWDHVDVFITSTRAVSRSGR